MANYGLIVTDDAAQFIADEEGGQSADGLFYPYYDKWGRVNTQGYGHTEGVKLSDKPWTQPHAERVLKVDDLPRYARMVDEHIPNAGKLPQPVQNGLLSACYNLGPGYIAKLASNVNRGKFTAAAKQLLAWDHAASGDRLAGLTQRRRAEAHMLRLGTVNSYRWRAELAYLRWEARRKGGWRRMTEHDRRRATKLKGLLKRKGKP